MRRCVHIIAINHGFITKVVHILHKERDSKFLFKVNMLRRQTKPVELSHKWYLKIFKYQEPEFYAKLFDESKEGPFEVPTGHTKIGVI